MKTRIHVNQHKIRSNMKHGTNDPVITVKTSKSNIYTHEVDIKGPSKVIYRENRGSIFRKIGSRLLILPL